MRKQAVYVSRTPQVSTRPENEKRGTRSYMDGIFSGSTAKTRTWLVEAVRAFDPRLSDGFLLSAAKVGNEWVSDSEPAAHRERDMIDPRNAHRRASNIQ